MKALINTLSTAGLTLLLYAGCTVSPALANLPVEQQIGIALQGESSSLQVTSPLSPAQPPLPEVDVAQIGSLFGDDGIPPVPEMTLERYRAMDAGSTSTCAIHRKDGHIVCWGLNDFGQANALLGSYSSLSMGQYHGCAIKKNGTLTCWGLPSAMPQGKQGTGRYRKVSSGDDHTCAIRNNKTLECWGDNSYGELEAPPGKYRDLSTRGNHSCAVTTDNQVKCWGETPFVAYTPASGRFTEVSTGQLHACALGAMDGKPVCWGNNSDGQATPPTNETFVTLVSGDYHTCGLRADHTALCWGRNQFGQTSLPSGDYRQIAGGGAQTCALTRRGGHLHCVGSFANNPFLTGQQTRQSALPDGMVAPQFAWAVFMPGLTSLFDDATSNVMDLLFDKDLNKWQKGGKGASIVFSLLGLVFGEVLPGDNADPLPPEYKEMLQDIQARVKELQATMKTVAHQVESTKQAVDKLVCANSTNTIREAAKYVMSDPNGTGAYGPEAYMRNAMNQYSLVMTDMTKKMPDRQKARADMEEFYKRVVEFKKQYMVGEKTLANQNALVTRSLLGLEANLDSPLNDCKKPTRNAWLQLKPYPFDDRPIWKGAYQTLRSARTTQATIANLLAENAGIELMAAFSGPKFRIDGSMEPDLAPPIGDYNPTAGNNTQGICEKADQESVKDGANSRWVRVKELCEKIKYDVRSRYTDHVRITEYMGGAYSDRDMVLSLTARQMGDKESSDDGEENWLWLRNPLVGDFREPVNRTGMKFAAKDDKSPFNGLLIFKDSQGNPRPSDAEVYMTNEDAFSEGVWHSSKFAWNDLFEARSKVRKLESWKLDETYEDVIERMAEETVDKDIEPSCQKNAQGNCEVTRVLQDGQWVDQLVPGEHLQRIFTNVKQVPFWAVHTGKSWNAINSPEYFWGCMGLKAWSDCNINDRAFRAVWAYSFIASGINKAKVVNGQPTGPHWYHNDPYDESKGRSYLKLSGKVATADEMAATYINARGWVGGHDCRDESECIGLGFSIFAQASDSFKPYQTAQWFVRGDDKNDPPRLLTKYREGSRQYEIENWYEEDFWERARFTHMPVVRISQRKCHNSLIASNANEVIDKGASPQFDRPRNNKRAADDVTVPSICGRDLDLTIKQTMTRPANVDMPEVKVIP